jgi:hypothetical protein
MQQLISAISFKRSIGLLFCCMCIAAAAQIPATPNARYQLNNNSATDVGGSSFNGTLTLTANTTSRLGTANSAISFTSVTSSGFLPAGLVTALQNDFTVGFWFKTAMIANTGAQWYNGNSLVDGEVGGVTNDWGICLIDGGKVCLGVGNPDITIKSASTYNNNAWHFATATRSKAGGSIVLYVDGSQVASSTGINTASLSAPSVIGLGRSSAVAVGNYTGSLDDLITYNRVLSGAEVTSLYNAMVSTALPVQWLSFTASTNSNKKVNLTWQVEQTANVRYFEPEYATDGIHFTSLEKIPAMATNGTNQTATYSINIDQPAGSSWLFRIKQTDDDGNFSYSRSIRLSSGSGKAKPRLVSNPVTSTLTLLNENGQTIHSIKITNAAGQIVMAKKIGNAQLRFEIAVEQLSTGYYVLSIDGDSSVSLSFLKK